MGKLRFYVIMAKSQIPLKKNLRNVAKKVFWKLPLAKQGWNCTHNTIIFYIKVVGKPILNSKNTLV